MALYSRRSQPKSAAHKSSRSGSTRGKSTRSKSSQSQPARRKKSWPGRRNAETDSDEAHPQGERLQKLLAASGLGSRRACEELIETGRVEVDREVVTTLGTRVDPVSQEIRVDGEALPRPRATYVLVHKVQGVVSTASDPSGRPRVTDMVPPNLGRLFPVGRLDMSSEGLILLTNDGELANRLTHPRYGVEKTYNVQVAGHIEPETLKELEKGIYLAEGVAKVVGASIKSHHKNSTILEMILDEGRNREIRRLLARVGHKVQRLTRVAMGPLKLGDVPPGAYRLLRRDEIEALKASVEEIPIGKRAPKKPRTNQGGSRKLLEKRKSDPAEQASGKGSKSSRAGSSGRPASKSAGRKSSTAAATNLPKPRTVIGDEDDFGSDQGFSARKASPGKSSPGKGTNKKSARSPGSPGKFGSASLSGSGSGEESGSRGSAGRGKSKAGGKKRFAGKSRGGASSAAGSSPGGKGKSKSKSGRSNRK